MPTLLVLLKYPTVGEVKTRLAASLGAKRAASLYQQWIGLVLDRLQPLRGRVRLVAYFDGAPLAEFAAWQPLANEWWVQPMGDLGDRLTIGFEKARLASRQVAAIGTDCLELDAPIVIEAFSQLENHDAVFGPTPDGGYYLVGTSRHLPGFFQGVPWSSQNTLAAHLARCQHSGWTAATLPPLRDIDTIDDWRLHCSKDILS